MYLSIEKDKKIFENGVIEKVEKVQKYFKKLLTKQIKVCYNKYNKRDRQQVSIKIL